MKKDPNVTAEDIIKFCGTQLTNYKVPKQIEFRTDLPKTNVGKILRRELRDEKKAARPELSPSLRGARACERTMTRYGSKPPDCFASLRNDGAADASIQR